MFSQREASGKNAVFLQGGEDFILEWTISRSRPVRVLRIQRMSKVDDASLARGDSFQEAGRFSLGLGRLLGRLGWLRCLARCNEKQSRKSHYLFHNSPCDCLPRTWV